MKTTVLVAMAAALETMAWAGSAERNVIVCLDKIAAEEVADQAETLASRMFRKIGVKLEWHEAGHFCQSHRNQVIAISLSTHTPDTLLPGALAYALPYEGVHIAVFYDRLTGPNGVESALLAHVLVHEITHILQGTNRHSASGIMMARWDQKQRSRMKSVPLTFTRQDVDLINSGLDARASAAELAAAR